MRLLPAWPSRWYRLFCSHTSTSAIDELQDDGSWVETGWKCLRCGKKRGEDPS